MRSPTVIVLFATALLFASIAPALADVYLHNPRGSNNRLDGANTDTDNENRLFDSQDNAKGGYNTGYMYYHGGSILSIEWTAQHGSGAGNGKVISQFILQYMCDNVLPDIRDGTSETTITPPGTDYTMGQHEPYKWYAACAARERNMGLYTADQNMRGRTKAINTRQNPTGTRYGFECPEERDYYPYWHPTPWIDIAVLTSEPQRCRDYRANSGNNQRKGMCALSAAQQKALDNLHNETLAMAGYIASQQYNNPTNCTDAGYEWRETSLGVAPPDCLGAPLGRDNYLGNVVQQMADGKVRGGFPAYYNWTLPEVKAPTRCVLRMRYNISTGDYPSDLNSTFNNVGQPQGVTDDPVIDFADEQGVTVQLQLAVDTAQYGRTFQDRSHVFEIAPRSYGKGRVYNLNVRGKRGNIVEVYPAVEYDFVPNELHIRSNDRIHLQWTGSNSNPQGNDGEGVQGSDRSNFVQTPNGTTNYPAYFSRYSQYPSFRAWRNPNSQSAFFELRRLALNLNIGTNELAGSNNQDQMNDAAPYFDFGLLTLRRGRYTYMSTRNNNFSNRSQKGQIFVLGKSDDALPIIVWIGIAIFCAISVTCLVIAWGVYGIARPDSRIGHTWVMVSEWVMSFVNH